MKNELQLADADGVALESSASVEAATRAQSEIQASAVMAMRNPRSEPACYTRIMKACARPNFAERARYCYPRGGHTIEGPSVALARELGRLWGNLRYGYTITDADDLRTTIQGWAWDLETNSYNTASVSFRNLIQRKQRGGGTRWVQPDERDYRELCAKHGAIASRNAILQILPPDIVDEAMRAAKSTLSKAAAGEIEQSRDETVRRLALAFAGLGVTVEMLEGSIGGKLENVTAEQLADLRGTFQAVRDGQITRDAAFPPAGTENAQEKPSSAALDDLKRELRKARSGSPAKGKRGKDTDDPPSAA